MRRYVLLAVLVILWWSSGPSTVVSTAPVDDASMSSLWERPQNLEARDLLHGNWSIAHAPDPHAVYTFIRPKKGGANPGVVVQDPAGRIWHVKQPSRDGFGDEGPVEVVVSRVLGAVGYHQPPIYFLPSFTMITSNGKRQIEPGGRFRLAEPSLHDMGTWSWKENPFIGTQPFDGLLVMLLTFSSWDLKDSNNTLYRHQTGGREEYWYVVRDLGGALGETGGGLRPKRNNIDKFERQIFITHVHDKWVDFDYRGKQPEILHHRITVDDVRWACGLLGRLSNRQWHDAFAAGGYDAVTSERFIRKIHDNIAQGQQLVGRSE
jgi:hypothetical protein